MPAMCFLKKIKNIFSASCFYLGGGVFSGAVCKITELLEPNRPYKKKGRLIYMRGVAGVVGYGGRSYASICWGKSKEIKD